MDINLKVSPAELEAKATDFKGVMRFMEKCLRAVSQG